MGVKLDIDAVMGDIERQLDVIKSDVTDALTMWAMEVVNTARSLPQPLLRNESDRRKPHQPHYIDDTGNLRQSLGFVVYDHGKRVFSGVDGNGEGTRKADELCEEVAGEYPDKIVCVVVAGMNYAAYVESKGYDVISGSIKAKEGLLRQYLEEVIKNVKG